MTCKKENARPKSAAEYKLTLTDLHGHELCAVNGSLTHCLSIMGDTVYCFRMADLPDSYHKVRRELIRGGGAYSRFFLGVDGPVELRVIDCSLIPCRPVETAPPLSGGAIAAQNDRIASEVVWQNPAVLSGFSAPAPVPQPTPLEILIENDKRAIEVPLTIGQMSDDQLCDYLKTGSPQFGLVRNQHPLECTCIDCRPSDTCCERCGAVAELDAHLCCAHCVSMLGEAARSRSVGAKLSARLANR